MRIVVIYDSRRSEKYALFVDELLRQGINEFEVMPCVPMPTVVESISESFKAIIRKAKEKGEEEIVIAEDDIHFPHANGWEYYLSNKPKEYDVYLGCSYLIDNRNEYKEPVIKVAEWVGNQLITVHSRYYDRWLATDSKKHCDTVHAGVGEFYVCFPFVALQRPGWSANNKAPVNYNSEKVLPREYIYR